MTNARAYREGRSVGREAAAWVTKRPNGGAQGAIETARHQFNCTYPAHYDYFDDGLSDSIRATTLL